MTYYHLVLLSIFYQTEFRLYHTNLFFNLFLKVFQLYIFKTETIYIIYCQYRLHLIIVFY